MRLRSGLFRLSLGGGKRNVVNPLIIADSFAGVNGTSINGRIPNILNTPGNAWVLETGTFTIQSNAAQSASGTTRCVIDAENPNLIVKFTYKTGQLSAGNNDFCQLAFRFVDSQNFWCVTLGKVGGVSTWKLYETVNNSTLEKASGSYTYVANTIYTLSLTANGASITATYNGGTAISIANAASLLTATKVGIINRSDASTNLPVFDDFQVYTL